MSVNKYFLPILIVAALLGSVLIAQLSGQWTVSGKVEIQPGSLTDPEDIKGWMTLNQVAEGFAIPLDDLYARLALPADLPAGTALKDLEKLIEGFEVTIIREAVTEYTKGGSAASAYTPSPATVVPENTIASTAMPATQSPETDHLNQGDGTGTGPTSLPEGQVLPGAEIKGRHTLAEIVTQCQVPVEDLLAALGLPSDFDLNTEVKDIAGSGTITEVQAVRDAVTRLQK
jgi:hypothetical protein